MKQALVLIFSTAGLTALAAGHAFAIETATTGSHATQATGGAINSKVDTTRRDYGSRGAATAEPLFSSFKSAAVDMSESKSPD
jgi:hypothetical protein